jgi:exopolysaccharide production protein ExoQ
MRGGFRGGVEIAFCYFALLTLIGAYTSIPLRLQGVQLQGGEASPLSTAANSVLLAGIAILVAMKWREFLFVARHGGAVNLFLLLGLVSVLWSYSPAISARRWVPLLMGVAFAYYLVASYPMERIIRHAAAALGMALVASTIVALIIPSLGVMSEPQLAGAWSGVFGHKTSLGHATVLGVMCYGWLWRHEPRHRLLYALALLLCLFLAVMSKSKTAQLAILIIISFAVFLPALRWPGLVRIWAIYGMVVVGAVLSTLMLFNFSDIMEALGKDATLTGRVPVWTSLLEIAAARPFGGYGYNAFFVAGNPAVEAVWRSSGWEMWGAHNNSIQLLLDLGIPGLALALWAMAEMIWRALHAWSTDAIPWASFAAIFGITATTSTFVEDSLLRTGDIQGVLFIAILVALRLHAAAHTAANQAASLRPGRRMHPSYELYR